MKIKNHIEEKYEHSHIIEILNQNSNSALLRVDPWIDWVFKWKNHKICARKRKNNSEKRKKNEEQLRERKKKKRKESRNIVYNFQFRTPFEVLI